MKILQTFFLILSSCSSWEQKDFRKEIEKSKAQEVRVQVSEDLRDKFEIQPVEKKEENTTISIKPAEKTRTKIIKEEKKVLSKVVKQSVNKSVNKFEHKIKPASKIPEDYPEELKLMNERVKKVWSDFRPNFVVNQKTYLDINYLGMTVGKIMFTNLGKKQINNKDVWHFNARFKSAPFYSKIYELDDTIDTFVTADEFLSSRYSLIQRESKFDIDDLQLYDREKLKSFWFYKQKKSDGSIKNKNKETYIPYFSIDPLSVLFLLQGLPLNNGDKFDIPVINKGKILVVKTSVEGRESIETKRGPIKAIKLHATTKFVGEHLKDGDMLLWFSDDDKRTLIKVKAKIKIGSITADLVEG